MSIAASVLGSLGCGARDAKPRSPRTNSDVDHLDLKAGPLKTVAREMFIGEGVEKRTGSGATGNVDFNGVVGSLVTKVD